MFTGLVYSPHKHFVYDKRAVENAILLFLFLNLIFKFKPLSANRTKWSNLWDWRLKGKHDFCEKSCQKKHFFIMNFQSSYKLVVLHKLFCSENPPL